jgi:hypothetical protein
MRDLLLRCRGHASIPTGRPQENFSLGDEAEWMSYFNEQKAKAQARQAQIDRTVKEIDRPAEAG